MKKSISIILLFISLFLLGDCDKPPAWCKCDQQILAQNPVDKNQWTRAVFGSSTIYNVPCDSEGESDLRVCFSVTYNSKPIVRP